MATHLWIFVALELFYTDLTWVQTHSSYLAAGPVVTFTVAIKRTRSSKDRDFCLCLSCSALGLLSLY